MRKTETKDEIIQGLMTTINNLNEEISLLREQVAYLTQKLYGNHQNKLLYQDKSVYLMKRILIVTKMRIFPVETEEITYHRRKHKAKRADILEAFTSEKVHHQLTGKDLLCPDCQKEMKEIGSWSVRQELLKIVKAPVPKAPLAHSYGSASIIAHTFYQKYELKVPA